MIRRLTWVLAVVLLVVSACGDDAAEVTTPGSGGDDTTEPAPPGEGDEMPAPVCLGTDQPERPEYRGIAVDAAIDLAADQGLDVREVGRDGECFPVTDDLRDDRVNIEVVGDMVVAAAIY